MNMLKKNDAIFERAKLVIPGGIYGHQSVKQLPKGYPQYFAKADGAYTWDVDGNRYVDYMCGFGTNLLGYRNPEVESAALAQLMLGDTVSGPSELMVTLAEQFVSMITHADWAMFCKNGSDATSIALVAARAYRNKKKILLATGAYHGAAPWNTPVLKGVTPEDRANIIYFEYNNVESLTEAFKAAEGDIAGLYATPFRHEVFEDAYFPSEDYAKAARRLCDEHDALLIVDEVRTGLRLSRDCVWSAMGVQPDLSTWGKAIGNGHCISAVLGSDKVRQAAEEIFVTGSYWYSSVPMAAALATLKQVQSSQYLEHTIAVAQHLRDGIAKQALAYDFELKQTGPAVMPQMLFANDPDVKTGGAWTVAMLKHGAYLHPYHNMFLSAAHTFADIELTLQASEAAFIEISKLR
ncbi:aminotransferase class III-fold pyridoxal phosphate-dependent enzyme [Pseudomonas nabeulensis]|uniref:Aminotransferase class III-fold pyridoxal phosphate-dependent enzyme n=1 Tax=Pseudomonas nabeulensis TaxID=2293833 RepID=A0A4Z0AFJ7_9PSED|nr:aminotransferase class III-fold pyridoxal phosphate-dependent enzyme [Pseudomonas nabeulensis]TFY85522.1 aminotransferase class III-fold pyridoxal phosphate-dependent enzyme [Pseudomonas nabeulensis]